LLDAKTIWFELHALVAPHEPVLFCWERPPLTKSNWCHRSMVAAWFKRHLGESLIFPAVAICLQIAIGLSLSAHIRWHDLRHTWASCHVQAGTPLHVLQELGGWECVEMVRKYAHLSTAHLHDTWTACKAHPRFGWWREGRRWPAW